MVVIMNNMNRFQLFESKLERVGGFFATFFMAMLLLPLAIVAVFGVIGEALQGVFESVGRNAAARQMDKRS